MAVLGGSGRVGSGWFGLCGRVMELLGIYANTTIIKGIRQFICSRYIKLGNGYF
jgi:hypothetical protein